MRDNDFININYNLTLEYIIDPEIPQWDPPYSNQLHPRGRGGGLIDGHLHMAEMVIILETMLLALH